MKKILALTLTVLMFASILPLSALASEFDTSVSGDYFTVISEETYALAPGATETEMVLNNSEGSDRKVVHYFEVDTKNENIEVLPGYYGIDKLDPDNLALEGVADKSQYWKAEQLTKTVAYYESLGYNVVGAMNTALAYDSDAPYGYMVMNGVVLGTPEVHKGAQTYLAIDAEGNCELRSMSTPLDGSEVTAISANFGWIVKDGELVTKTVERTSSDASRSMIGIKADGTLVFCLVDGRNAPFSTGLSNYELGEMMLSLGCVNAVNCDGGGSSTFVSKREGESENTMRSIPSDGSERATINSVIIVSKAKATGEFDHAVLSSYYDYFAPGTAAVIKAKGVDAAGSPAELPESGISWELSDSSFGTVENGVFLSNGKKGDVTVKMLYNGELVGEKTVHIVDPDVFALALDETVLPYGKSMNIDFSCTYGADDWAVCVDGAYTLALSDNSAATLNGSILVGTSDESIEGVNVTATYIPNPAVTDVLKVTYGKGSEIVFDFEDGDVSNFLGVDEMYDWAEEVGASAPIQSNSNYSENTDSETFLSSDIVRNGNYALGVTLDYTDATFASWSYNMFFYTGDVVVLRDVANGKNATTFGMWVYIPEGAAGLAMQIQGYKNLDGTGGTGAHFMFTTTSGAVKNLNSCTEADIPESRWVYATVDLTQFGDFFATYNPYGTNGREPSFIRFYIKPTTAATLTFYFDDFTLDYSSAVDDRVLPTITDTSYTTQDESVALNNGAVINGNSISFSAVVADNIKLDNATGKIYVDGNVLENVAVSGKYLATTSNVILTSGVHTVAFEIKDTLGNAMKVTRTFTVAGDPAVVLDGHNDGGFKPGDDANAEGAPAPEYGSVYYVDINVADITAINTMNVALGLQTGNTWEPQGITVADGFKVTYNLNKVEQIITLTIERNGETVNADADCIVSVPVRLWTWNGSNHVTDTPITPESQFATGYCPVIKVECKVINGLVNGVDAFGGSISVATKLNDNVYPWHYHDAELTVLNKDATCTADGYTGRTYCETCKSVVDWGTTVPANGHNYVNGVCGCGAVYTYTGLKEENGNWYYYINGVPASGWQMIGTDWYYFDTTTSIGANGNVKVGDVTYNFANGKLTSGVWAKTLHGNRYYYGPGYYKSRDGIWVNIEGKDYFFNNHGIALNGGWQLVIENQVNRNWYYFDENGVCPDKNLKPEDGFYTDRNGLAYSKDGKALHGIQYIDGKYYYFDSIFGYAQKGQWAGRLYGDDYAAYTGLLEENGVVYYYLDGRTGPNGLVEVDGSYYYSYWGGVIKTGTYYVSTSYCDLPVGEYTFGEDGKALNGVYDSVLYANGKKASEGLYKINGEYYLADGNGSFRKNGTYFASVTYCDLPAKRNYSFDSEGKMLNGVEDVNGTLYLYVNGTTATYGLYEIDGEYYFSNWGGVLMTDGRYYVSTTFCDLPANANYSFGTDGKMLNGVEEVEGKLYLYKNGTTVTYGLYEVDGEYYYAYWGGVIMTDGRYYISTTFCNLPANANYSFGADGKMLNGVEEVDGKLYLYKNGTTVTYGLYEIDGEYYFSDWGGILKVDGIYYVSTTFCDLAANKNYAFGSDGKMYNGVESINGGLYLYNNGLTVSQGLYKIGDDYYYSDWGGVLKTDGTYYVNTSKCDLSANRNYTFGADGKMLNGFVTKEDGIYYYENGNTPAPKILYIDGYYYYVTWGGKVVTNTSCYVPADGVYTDVPMVYEFDELGRLI